MPRLLKFLLSITPALLLLLLSACTTEQTAAPALASENPAVQGLLDAARGDMEAGRTAAATASLERALRIEPRNPRVWHELALVHLQQGDYANAEGLAARSNSYAGGDRRLITANWHLIAEARLKRGDEAGARMAQERETAE